MLQHLNETCKQFYQPYHNISIDERMVKFKAKFPMQQYIKKKKQASQARFQAMVPLWFQKWFYMVAASVQGKGEQRTENWLSYNVVISLAQGLDKQGHIWKLRMKRCLNRLPNLKRGKYFHRMAEINRWQKSAARCLYMYPLPIKIKLARWFNLR